MNQKLFFGLAICLIAVYAPSIDCAEASPGVEYKFSADKKVPDSELYQVQCGPEDLCKKITFKEVICKGNLVYPINDKTTDDYSCKSDEYSQSKEQVEWTYKVNCTKEAKTDEPGKNPTCAVQITLKDTTPKSKAGWIIGIVILVIAVLVGVVAFLGYRGIGPMSSVFNK